MTDYRYLALGAGVQSSTLAEMVVEGELETVDAVIFSDTGDEPSYVYRQVDYLKGRLDSVGIPLIVVRNGNLVDDLYGDGRFAPIPFFTRILEPIEGFGRTGYRERKGRLRRQCTRQYKITPIEREVRKELLRRGLAKRDGRGIVVHPTTKVECWLGISLDEALRVKPNRQRWITNRWPLIQPLQKKRSGCKSWLTKRDLPVPGESSCRRCPYHGKPRWRDMRDNHPADWEVVLQFDDDLRSGKLRTDATAKGELFLVSELVPLRELDLDTPEEQGQLTLLDMCNEGYCFG